MSTSSCQCMRQPWFSTATWFLRSLSCSLLGWSTALAIQSRMSPFSKQPWMGKHCLGLQLVQSPIPSRNSSQLSLVVAQQRYGTLLQQRRHFSGLRSSRSPTGYTRYHLSCKVWFLLLDPANFDGSSDKGRRDWLGLIHLRRVWLLKSCESVLPDSGWFPNIFTRTNNVSLQPGSQRFLMAIAHNTLGCPHSRWSTVPPNNWESKGYTGLVIRCISCNRLENKCSLVLFAWSKRPSSNDLNVSLTRSPIADNW